MEPDRNARNSERERSQARLDLERARSEIASLRTEIRDVERERDDVLALLAEGNSQNIALGGELATARHTISLKETMIGNLVTQLGEKNEKLRSHTVLSETLNSQRKREEELLLPLAVCVANGAVEAAKREGKKENPSGFEQLASYSDPAFITGITTDIGDEVEGKDRSLKFLCFFLSEVMDQGKRQFAPNSGVFEEENSSDSMDTSVGSNDTGHKAAPVGKLRYELKKQHAISTICALILSVIDIDYKWGYGWLLALETRKLAASDRFGLILSKSLPMPSNTSLMNELKRQVKVAEENNAKPKQNRTAIILDVFDNISTGFGYIRKTSRGGKKNKKRKNPVCTAWSKWHFVLTEEGGKKLKERQEKKVDEAPEHPPKKISNTPMNSKNLKQLPEDYWTPTTNEIAMVIAECKLSLQETLEEVSIKHQSEMGQVGVVLPKKSDTIKCFYCQLEWSSSKRKCCNEDSTVGCFSRIRGSFWKDRAG